MKKSKFKFALLILLLTELTCLGTAIKTDSTFTLLELDKLQETKKLVAQNNSEALATYKNLLKEADEALTKGPFSVMNKIGIPPSGSKHDYMSLAPYFWPNPETPNGLPYIRKDGEVNPETRNNYSDYTEKERFFEALSILGKAFYYSDNKKYAKKAIELMNVWFIDTATIMNPHLNYGQGIPGVNDGRPFGVIEFGGLKDVITTLELLKLGGVSDSSTEEGVKMWLKKYSTWLQTSELGTMEGTRSNNHGTTYDVQLCSILLYLNEKEQVINILENVSKQRIASQIEPDGSQPHELERTKAFSYSTMNLSAFTKLAWFGKKLGVDLWNYKTEDGRGIKTAYEFLIPYIETNKEWKYQQIESKTTYQQRFANLLLYAGKEFDEPRYTKIAESFFERQGVNTLAQERPFIWVQQNEKEAILQKIEQQSWAKSLHDKFLERLEADLNSHQKDVADYLNQLPFDRQKQVAGTTPPFKLIIRGEPDSEESTDKIMQYLQTGIDCGMFYYLTGEEKYAQCALDILNVALFGIGQLPFPTETGNHGWVFPEDHLYEARVFGAQVPIIYDFVAPFIKKGGRPYDLGMNQKIDFPTDLAQKVFFGYAKLAIDQGMTGSNWSVLEAPSFVQNLLALDNKAQRDSLLEIYLTIGSPRQDPLSEIASHYKKLGDVYPETSQYSSSVSSLSTTMITVVEKYNPNLHLAEKYPYLTLALSRWEVLKYPNDEIVRFGDGKRHGGTSYPSCEIAYYLGKTTGSQTLTETFGDLLQTAISKDEYRRGELRKRSYGASAYFEPLQLLWACPTIDGNVENRKIPRTDEMPHASVFLQRNLSKTGKAVDGLMCFVGGAHMVHGHANGMNIELYGKGQVLGVDHGNGAYRKDIHENYSRLFAAHNTVIVNGNSQSDSGWVNLGINPVQLITMEPMPREEAVSPFYSFSITSFEDDKGEKAEAYQERTLALIRTSETTGYYVDVFRSKSKLPNEYHDYLYHNIGDKLEFLNDDLKLNPTPERYMENANLPWVQNRQYRHPGWHFFDNIQTSQQYSKDVKLRFVADKFEKPIYMDLYIPGFEKREYTKVEAPKTFEAPTPYENKPTPTLLIRKTGEAWNEPFVVVYEPSDGNVNSHSVQKVEKLVEDGVFKGLKIESWIAGKKLRQYVLTPAKGQDFRCKNPEITFKGTFAIITVNDKDKLQNIYIGDGEQLHFGDIILKPDNQKKSAFREYSN